MRISSKGLSLVKAFEGCLKPTGDGRFRPYRCPAGVLTIGWGHTNAHGRQFDQYTKWTQEECDAVLREDLAGFERAVQRLVRVPLKQNEFDALVSFAYNCGEGALAKSTLLRKLNKGDYRGATAEFAKWNRGGGRVLKGLTRRRAAEAAMFRGDGRRSESITIDQENQGDPVPQQVDPPAPPMTTSKIGNAQVITGGAAAGGVLDQINDAAGRAAEAKNTASDLGLFDILSHLVHRPLFWVFVAICVAAAATWYWRRQHRQEGV
jgi:lysozyme